MNEEIIEYPDGLDQWCNYLIIAYRAYENWSVVATSDSVENLIIWGQDNPAHLGEKSRIVKVMSPYYEEESDA